MNFDRFHDFVEEAAQEYKLYRQYVDRYELSLLQARLVVTKGIVAGLRKHRTTYTPDCRARRQQFFFVGRGFTFVTLAEVDALITELEVHIQALSA